MKDNLLKILLFAFIALVLMDFGAGLLDVLVFFPNWFHSLPDSVAVAKQFSRFRNPGIFFLPITALVLLSGMAFLIAGWRTGPVRTLVLIGVLLKLAILLMTGVFIYPRIYALMSNNPLPLEAMQQTATEMMTLVRIRAILGAAAAFCAMTALWRFAANAPKSVEK